MTTSLALLVVALLAGIIGYDLGYNACAERVIFMRELMEKKNDTERESEGSDGQPVGS